MLTSDFASYSETDSLISSSSGYLSSEIDSASNETNENSSNNSTESPSAKKRSKSRQRAQKKVKYWTLPTMSSGTFNPSMLTARQQLQYLAQKSKLGEESDSLELSPLRLDRIKFEEMKSLSSKEQENSMPSNKPQMLTGPSSPLSTNSTLSKSQSSPSARSNSKQPQRSSKLKEEVSSSPLRESTKAARMKNSNSKAKKVKSSAEESDTLAIKSDNVIQLPPSSQTEVTKSISKDTEENVKSMTESDHNNTAAINGSIDNVCINPASLSVELPKTSLFESARNFLFNYNDNRRKHFDNFLKDFAKRLGLSVDDEIVQRKKQEIINKGMI